MYVNFVLNHFRAIQAWARETGAHATLDAKTFHLEVKYRNRYFNLHPQFVAEREGKLCNVPELTHDAAGFCGWLPYRPYSVDLASDKLLFKSFLVQHGLKTPAWWSGAEQARADFVLKRSIGSFGAQIAGPFRFEDRQIAEAGDAERGAGTLFAEQFIEGQILKIWCWGQKPFFAHAQSFAFVIGDGETGVDELARARRRRAPEEWATSAESRTAAACARYQGVGAADRVAVGREVFVDFRYGHVVVSGVPSPDADDAFQDLPDPLRTKIDAAASIVGLELKKRLSLPVAFALDAMVDSEGEPWWLEMNSNPVLPPPGYATIFASLFA